MSNDQFPTPRPADPVPSAKSTVINDDALVLDYVVNGTGLVETRTGKMLLSLDELGNKFGWRNAGLFSAGFTYESKRDYGVTSDGKKWIYNGQTPFTVAAGVVPAEPTYSEWFVNEHNDTLNRNAVGAHDAIYSRSFSSVQDFSGFTGSALVCSVNIESWRAGFGYGGGILTWNASALKSTHNGGTVFSPTVPYSTVINYLNGVGETDHAGSGCWVRNGDVLLSHFGIVKEGQDQTSQLEHAYSSMTGRTIKAEDGEYNTSAFPSNIDNVHLSASTRVKWTDKVLPCFSGVMTDGLETALVNGVIRYYPAGGGGSLAGWYLLKNQGQDHDPILLEEVQPGPQQTGLRITVSVAALGLDPNLWTPSGVVVGPDETLAKEGMTFGSSVGSDDILIQGSYNTPSNTRFSHSMGSGLWVASGSSGSSAPAYTAIWTNGGTGQARLRITRTSGGRLANPGSYNGAQFMVVPGVLDKDFTMTPFTTLITQPAVDGSLNTFIDVMFFSLVDGSRIQTESSDMRLFIVDHQARNTEVRFNTFADFYGNIWISGAFVRKPSSL